MRKSSLGLSLELIRLHTVYGGDIGYRRAGIPNSSSYTTLEVNLPVRSGIPHSHPFALRSSLPYRSNPARYEPARKELPAPFSE